MQVGGEISYGLPGWLRLDHLRRDIRLLASVECALKLRDLLTESGTIAESGVTDEVVLRLQRSGVALDSDAVGQLFVLNKNETRRVRRNVGRAREEFIEEYRTWGAERGLPPNMLFQPADGQLLSDYISDAVRYNSYDPPPSLSLSDLLPCTPRLSTPLSKLTTRYCWVCARQGGLYGGVQLCAAPGQQPALSHGRGRRDSARHHVRVQRVAEELSHHAVLLVALFPAPGAFLG